MIKSLLLLFLSMMKVGAFTFGGGYAMIRLLESEFVEKRGWIGADEFSDLVVLAESTPGPIAINCSTYIGYKRSGFLGAAAATVGMCLPSLVIIFLISLYFDQFLAIGYVAAAFKGIRVAVIFLILSAGLKMLKKMKKSAFSVSVMLVTLVASIVFTLLSVSFSSILYILIFGGIGLAIYTTRYVRSRTEAGK